MTSLSYLIEMDRKKGTVKPQASPSSSFAARALNLGELAALCNCPETSLSRLLVKHGVLADIRIGSRVAFSSTRANDISSWYHALQHARTALSVIDGYETNPLGTGSPLSEKKQAPLLACARHFETAAAAKLAKLLNSQKPNPKTA